MERIDLALRRSISVNPFYGAIVCALGWCSARSRANASLCCLFTSSAATLAVASATCKNALTTRDRSRCPLASDQAIASAIARVCDRCAERQCIKGIGNRQNLSPRVS